MTQRTPTKPCHPIRKRFLFRAMGKRKILCLRLLLIVPLVLVLMLVIVAQTGLAGALILPAIERQLGVEIVASTVSINRSGQLVIEGVRIRAPGIAGPGGELGSVRRIEADMQWLRGRVLALTFVSPGVRISTDTQTGVANIASFRLPEAGSVGGPVTLPSVRVEGGSIELAEHNERSIRVLKRLNIEGSLLPKGDDAYTIALTQTGAREGIDLSGTIDRLGVEVMLSGLSLDEWGPTSVPGRLRPFVEMLDVKGEISNTTFSLSSSGTVTAAVHLSGVAMTLPIDMNEASGAGRMRMHEVSGAISLRDDEFSAEISGLLEDVPYEVSLTYQGLTADAPFQGNFKVRGYAMATNPDFVPFLPAEVGHRLRQFAGASLMAESEGAPISPSAVVDASVWLWRGPPTTEGASPLDFRGNLSFTKGTAAYEIFPYPFQNMAGSVQFDSRRIRIEEIRGVSHTGAAISATGLIEPIGPTAMVNLQIDTVGVPLDDVLEEALGPNRGGIMDELFDDRRYQQLAQRGLILTPERARTLTDQRERLTLELDRAKREGLSARAEQVRAQLASVSEQLRTPVFEYRGLADLGIRLRREEGEESIWSRQIEIRLPRAGVVLADFPLPIHARDAVVVVTEESATLMRGSFRPLGGGGASLTGAAALRAPDGETAFRPAFRLRADAMPVSDLLTFAIAPPPLPDQNPASAQGRRAAAEVLDRLGVTGSFDADGLLLTRQDGGLGFDLELTPANIVLAPEPMRDRSPLLITDLAGTLRVTERGLSVSASGLALGVDDDRSLEAPVRVSAAADLDWSGEGPLRYDADIQALGAILELPVEQAVASVSEAGGAALAQLRETFAPEGLADVRAKLTSDGQNPVTDVRLTNLASVEADYLGGRLELRAAEGEVRALIAQDRTLTTDGLSGDLYYEGEYAGQADVVGTLGLDEHASDPARELGIALTGGRFESLLARRVVRDLVGGAPAKEYLEHEARGVFDALVSMTAPRPDLSGEPPTGVARLAFVETTIEPRWAEFTREGATLSLGDMRGRIVATRRGARIENLSGASPALRASMSGATTPDGSGGTVANLTLDLDAPALGPELRAALPKELLDVLASSEIAVNGPLSIRAGRLRTHKPAGTESARAEFAGVIAFADAAITAGVRVERARGQMAVLFERPLEGLPRYELDVVCDEASAMGLTLTDARAAVRSTGLPRGLVVPLLSAQTSGGALSGTAAIRPAGDWAGPGEREYESRLSLSGMRLNEVMGGLASARTGVSREPKPDTGARLTGEIALAGLVGRDETRRGGIDLQIAGGKVLDVPGAMRLIEAGNLQLPVSDAIDFASVEAVVDGSQIAIEGMSLISRSVELLGYGTASWPGLELDLRLRSRATRRIPVVSDLFQRIRDEFVTIAVTGTAAEPRVSVQSLSETRRVIGRALGFEESAGDRRLGDLRERADRQRRLRESRR